MFSNGCSRCQHWIVISCYLIVTPVSLQRLFPLVSNREPRYPRDLGELPGMKFPDLPSLDSYLRFWGTNETTKNTTLYTWINEEGKVVNKRSYQELHANASLISHKLLTSSKPALKPGDRVLLVYLPGLEFIDAFFGCMRARVIPVPVLPPDPLQRGGQALLKIENISRNCNAMAILSTSSYHAAVRTGFVKNMIMLSQSNTKSSASWPDLPWIHTDSWIKNSSDFVADTNVEELSDSQANDLCFLQFTSGSTGEAKGVMITHGGLIHNVKMMRRIYRSTSRTVLVSWLPQYHDMGLIGGLFTALVSGGASVLFSPMTFIRNPLLWLKTMSDYRATHSAGPNFAFELVLRRLDTDNEKEKAQTYDLSSMIFLMVAAEPVRQKTLKRFIDISSHFGLSEEVLAPGYGLAENCVFVSCAFGEGRPVLIDWQGRVCCGYANADDPNVDVRIVEADTAKELDDYGKEGEIWVSSPSAGIGYWGNEEQSQKTFYNKLESCPGRRFTRTGDLGRIIDGKLFITGRIKDLIIVAGRNIYSADVEKTVESASESLRPGCCAVIGVPEDVLSSKGISSTSDTSDEVGLVVIAEVRDGKPVNKEVVEQIKTKVAEEHGVSVASVKLIKPKTICKTTSGKIKRFECLKQFVDGTLTLAADPDSTRKSLFRSLTAGNSRDGRQLRSTLARTPTPLRPLHSGKDMKEITEFLRGLVSEQTGISIDKISATESLVSYGIDSIGVVRAAQKLSDYLGVPVGAVDIFTATCISDLASFSDNLLKKSKPQPATSPEVKTDLDLLLPDVEKSGLQKLGMGVLQLLALVYASSLLILPAYLSSSMLFTIVSETSSTSTLLNLSLLSFFLAPLVWICYIFLTCFSLSIFGRSFLQPNYILTPEVSIWSVDFVRWWALNKAQEAAGKILAVHLKGTVFLKHWFEMQGAKIGPSVLIDTIDITDPSLVSIGEGVVIAEGVLVQSHEVRSGVLSFLPVRIGRNVSVGPYAVLQKGSLVAEGSEVRPLQKVEEGKPVYKSENVSKTPKVCSTFLLLAFFMLLPICHPLCISLDDLVSIWTSLLI